MSRKAKDSVVAASHRLAARGWVPATSGNFSQRIDSETIAITASGKDKSLLTEADVLLLQVNGTVLESGKPSAETGLHLQLYQRDPSVNAVLHTHSLEAVWCSKQVTGALSFENLEILKAFPHVDSHEQSVTIPIFENTQDMPSLAAEVESYMSQNQQGVAYLIAGHGLYTWGESMEDCLRHVEALEYLFQYFRLTQKSNH